MAYKGENPLPYVWIKYVTSNAGPSVKLKLKSTSIGIQLPITELLYFKYLFTEALCFYIYVFLCSCCIAKMVRYLVYHSGWFNSKIVNQMNTTSLV